MTRSNFIALVLLQICGGLLLGLQTGWVPAALLYMEQMGNCTSFSFSEGSCRNAAGCLWVAQRHHQYRADNSSSDNNGSSSSRNSTKNGSNSSVHENNRSCVFKNYETVDCFRFSGTNASACQRSSPACWWASVAKQCHHRSGYDPLQQGLLAASLISGAAIGAFFAGWAVHKYGRIAVLKFVVSIPSLLGIIAEASLWQQQQQESSGEITSPSAGTFVAIVVTRVVFLGIAVGAVAVAAPLLSSESVAPDMKSKIGIVFQLLVTTGGFISSIVLYIVEIRPDDLASNDNSSPPSRSQLLARFHIFHGLVFVDAICLFVLSFWVLRESPRFLEQQRLKEQGGGKGQKEEEDENDNDNDATSRKQKEAADDNEGIVEENDDAGTTDSAARALLNGSDYSMHTPPRAGAGDEAAGSLHLLSGSIPLSGSISISPIDMFSPISDVSFSGGGLGDDDANSTVAPTSVARAGTGENASASADAAEWPLWRVVLYSFTLAAILQLTGVNAVLNFAPTTVMPALGVNPAIGNLILVTWFWLTTLATLCGVSRVKPYDAYLWSTIFLSCSSALIAIALLPSLPVHVMLGLGIAGLAAYALAFHCGTGPYFFVLASNFPGKKYQELGCTLCQLFQFLLNIVVVFSFPLLQRAMSGEDGDPQAGLSVMFFLFAGIGVVAVSAFSVLSQPKKM